MDTSISQIKIFVTFSRYGLTLCLSSRWSVKFWSELGGGV